MKKEISALLNSFTYMDSSVKYSANLLLMVKMFLFSIANSSLATIRFSFLSKLPSSSKPNLSN